MALLRANPCSSACGFPLWPRYHGRFLAEVGLVGLAHGNIDAPAAAALAADLEAAFSRTDAAAAGGTNGATAAVGAATGSPRTQRLDPSRRFEQRVVRLPAGSSFRCSFDAPSDKEQNSALVLLFVAGQLEANPRAGAALGLLAQMLKEPFFTALRTREQLGYVVGASELELGSGKGAGVSCLALTVLSKTASPPACEARASAFLKGFRAQLAATTPEAFAAGRAARITKLLEPPKQLASEAGQWWAEIQCDDRRWTR